MEALVFKSNGKPVTSSRLIAEKFGKRHYIVVRAIKGLQCSRDFVEHNFVLNKYTDGAGRSQEEYIITFDGFSFLAMGFTGKRAAEFKEEYINEFNKNKEELSAIKTGNSLPQTPTEALLQAVQLMAAQEKRVTAIEEDVTRLKAERRNRPEGLSVMAYGVIHHIPVNLKLASIVGRKAAKICRDKGIPVGRLKDPRFGYVGEYPEEVLEQAFEEAQK